MTCVCVNKASRRLTLISRRTLPNTGEPSHTSSKTSLNTVRRSLQGPPLAGSFLSAYHKHTYSHEHPHLLETRISLLPSSETTKYSVISLSTEPQMLAEPGTHQSSSGDDRDPNPCIKKEKHFTTNLNLTTISLSIYIPNKLHDL